MLRNARELAKCEDPDINAILKQCEEKIRGDNSYYSISDYEKLLRYCLDNKNPGMIPVLQALLSEEFIKQISKSESLAFFDDGSENEQKEASLFNIQFKLLLESVKTKDYEKASLILGNSNPVKLNLNKNISVVELKEMLPGATLLHLALKNNDLKMAELLMFHDALLEIKDYFLNTSLHYAARGGAEAYEFVKSKDEYNISQKNIFLHTPQDYLTIAKLPQIRMGMLTDQFTAYMKVNNFDQSIILDDPVDPVTGKNIIEAMHRGICQGDSFLRGIYILRGKDSRQIYNRMVGFIRDWDGKLESLDQPVTDLALAKDFPKLKNLFEYMLSVILFLHRHSRQIVGIDDSAFVSQFQFINNKNDKLEFKIGSSSYSDKNHFIDYLEELQLQPNSILFVSLADKNIMSSGHQITLVVDENKMLHFVDPNSPYRIPEMPLSRAAFEAIANIAFAYFNRVDRTSLYHYEPELQPTLSSAQRKPL